MPPTAISVICINKLLACVLRIEHLKKWALVLMLPALNFASWVFAVHSERSGNNHCISIIIVLALY